MRKSSIASRAAAAESMLVQIVNLSRKLED